MDVESGISILLNESIDMIVGIGFLSGILTFKSYKAKLLCKIRGSLSVGASLERQMKSYYLAISYIWNCCRF